MTGKFLLLVSGTDGSSRAEVAVLDTAEETVRRIESLVLAGFDPDRIRVFTGGETAVEVTHRPIVQLMKRDSGEKAVFGSSSRHQVEPELAPVKAHDVEPAPVLVAASSYDTQPVAERRFSDLFRRA